MLHRCGRRAPHRPGPSLPTKKPAAQHAAGFEWTPPEAGKFAFARGTGCLHPPFVALGGIACLAVGSCALLAHLLLQGMSAGRNLITLFSGVNNLSRSFFPALRRGVRATHGSRHPSPHRTHATHARTHHTHRLRASAGAGCSTSTLHACDASPLATSHRGRARAAGFAVVHPFAEGHRFSRRTSAFARKLRELLRARSPSASVVAGFGNEKTRGVSAAGSGCSGARQAPQCSSSSSSSA